MLGLSLERGGVELTRQSEIAYSCLAFAVEEHVRRLEVAMNDVRVVQGRHGGGDGARHVQRQGEIQRPGSQHQIAQ
jgi:hypothetical protein